MNEALGAFTFTWAYLIGATVFGIAGLYLFRLGKKRANAKALWLGVWLMVYPLFITNDWLVWGVGAFSSALAYYYLEQGETGL